jgi:hypothetical protein
MKLLIKGVSRWTSRHEYDLTMVELGYVTHRNLTIIAIERQAAEGAKTAAVLGSVKTCGFGSRLQWNS